MTRRAHLVALVLAAAALFAPGLSFAQATADVAACPSRAELDAAPGRVRAGDAAALAAFRATAPCQHWITFYFAAEHLIGAGDRDEAVRWFYVGQLRGRTVAALDRQSTPMLIGALQHLVGQPVNEYAGGDLAKLLAAIDWAIEWDRANPLRRTGVVRVGRALGGGATSLSFGPDGAIPLERITGVNQRAFDEAYAEQRRGIADLRAHVAAADPEEWRRQRRANGLE